jgi:hypothetical protein
LKGPTLNAKQSPATEVTFTGEARVMPAGLKGCAIGLKSFKKGIFQNAVGIYFQQPILLGEFYRLVVCPG